MKIIPITLALVVSIGCLGTGSTPPRDLSVDDSLSGQFIREIGPDTLKILLNNPYASVDPGLKVEELLYLLDHLSVEKMIKIIQDLEKNNTPGDGAKSILKLIYSIKRLGCNRVNPQFQLGDAASSYKIFDCTVEDFHHLDKMIKLVNDITDVEKLAALIKQDSLETVPALKSSAASYLETLAYLVIYLDDSQKLVDLVNGIIDVRDAVYFMDQFAASVLYPIKITNVSTGETSAPTSLINTLKLLNNIQDGNKLHLLINGKRTVKDLASEDPIQKDFIKGRLIPVLEGPAAADMNIWLLKLETLINNISQIPRMVDLLIQISAANIQGRLIPLIDKINEPENPTVNDNSVLTMAFLVDNVADISHLVYVVENISVVDNVADVVNGITTPDLNDVNSIDNNPVMTMAYIVDYVQEPSKVVEIIDTISTVSNLVDLINDISLKDLKDDNQIPDKTAAGKKLAMILDNLSFANLYRMRDVIDQINDPQKLVEMIEYLSIANSVKLADLIDQINVSYWSSSFSDWGNLSNPAYPAVIKLLNLLDSPSLPAPNNNSIRTLSYTIDNVNDASKMVYIVENIDAANMADLLDNVAANSQTPDALAAGQKFVNVIDNTIEAANLAFTINNVSNISQMADLLNALSIGSSLKIATLINTTSGDCSDTSHANKTDCESAPAVWTPIPNTWNATAANRGTSTGMGKVVNIVDFVTNLSDVALLIDNITDKDKLAQIVKEINNSSNLVGMINAVIQDADAVILDMVNLVNNIDGPNEAQNNVTKLTTILNLLGDAVELDLPSPKTDPHANHSLIAQLLAPQNNQNGGIGFMSMAVLISSLSQAGSEQRLVDLLNGLNANLIYNNAVANITKKEGLVRLLHFGVDYQLTGPTVFSGIGPRHIAAMLDNTSDTSRLLTIMNGANITDISLLVGCADHVGENYGNTPDFFTPCNAIGQW